MVRGSNAKIGSKRTIGDEDGDDLQALARQTLSDVNLVPVPPEPFAIGFDIASLAASSRPSRPSSEQTDGRIDLAAGRAASTPAPLAAAPTSRPAPPASGFVLRAAPSPAAAASSPIQPAVKLPEAFATARASTLDRELDDLIAARAFSPTARVASFGSAGVAALRKLPSWAWVLAAGVGIGLVAGGGLSDESEVAVSAGAASVPSSPVAGAQVAPTPTAVAAGVAWRPYAPGSTDRAAPQGSTRTGSTRHGTPATRARGEPGRHDQAVEEAPTAEGGERSIDELLDRALSPNASAGRASPDRAGAPAGLPSLPSREEVARVLSALQPRVRACAGERTGVATAQVVARSDGRIVSVRIAGAPFSRTSMGRCMESAVRSARFSRFARSTFHVSYPFRI